jgi:hypothetical protein
VVQPPPQQITQPAQVAPSPSFQQTPGQPPVMPQQNAQTMPQRGIPPVPSNDRQ